MLAMEKLEDQYKLVPWICVAIAKANLDSGAFFDLDGCRFKHMFVAFGAALNGFIFGCRKIMFIDGAHLSSPYKGMLLVSVALDTGNHLFDVAYALMLGEMNDE